jgi:nucleoside-diphosphate-sugar epimerase
MIYDVLSMGEASLVDGGEQRRSFTWIGDAIEGLMAVIRNEGGKADGEIFNIGNPENNCSMREFAAMLIEEMGKIPAFSEKAKGAKLLDVDAALHYGEAYDDMSNRVPSIEKIGRLLGWRPKTPLRDMLRMTLEWYGKEGDIHQ